MTKNGSSKKIWKIVANVRNQVDGQLNGAIYYFENDSEIKGFNEAYSAAEWAAKLSVDIKTLLDDEARRLTKKNR